MDSAGRHIGTLVSASLAQNTWVSYDADWQGWRDWCGVIGAEEANEATALLLYIGHCHEIGWSVSRVSRCVAGLAFGFRLRGRKDITKDFLVVQALKGWRRQKAVAEDWRRPVSFTMLQDLGLILGKVCKSDYEVCLFKLAFSLAFFGALRIGELVSPSTVRAGGLRNDDVNLFTDRVEFRLRRSKTDQVGKGRSVVLFAVAGTPVCPVYCLGQFRYLQGGSASVDAPLLAHRDGSFLSKFQFVRVLRKAIRGLGLDESLYAGHSFRIGAATEAARLGFGEEVIKHIGRWESRRFRSYVRL